MQPAIVVVAYNRHRPLERLLRSLAAGKFPVGSSVPLVISIDYHPANADVVKLAEEFPWPAGPKTVIRHPKNLGLRQHILACGDLTRQFGSIILLEDDLTVAPPFYIYASEALAFYHADPRIAGISLYRQQINETAARPFEPLDDGNDVFFLQLASSWGQAWSQRQWEAFRAWYDNTPESVSLADRVPSDVVGWPHSSWKKHFIKYLVVKDAYFVYPRRSLSTNFGEIGTHYGKHSHVLQTNLLLGDKPFYFSTLDETLAVYDAFHELLPDRLKRLNQSLSGYDFDVDLYASKHDACLTRDLVLTAGAQGSGLQSFGRGRRPHEAGVIFNDPGPDFILCPRATLRRTRGSQLAEAVRAYRYDMPIVSRKRNLALSLASALADLIPSSLSKTLVARRDKQGSPSSRATSP